MLGSTVRDVVHTMLHVVSMIESWQTLSLEGIFRSGRGVAPLVNDMSTRYPLLDLDLFYPPRTLQEQGSMLKEIFRSLRNLAAIT